MKLQLLSVAALLGASLLAPSAPGQDLTVLQVTRTVQAQSYGYDYDYDDGLSQSHSTGASGAWDQTALADQSDWWGYAVARGKSQQVSDVAPDHLTFDLDVSAETFGNHFLEDSSALGDFDVAFQLPALRRYLITADVDVTLGYNQASVELREAGAAAKLFDVSVAQVGLDTGLAYGWLPPGDYQLLGHAEVSAFGNHTTTELQQGSASAELRFFHPGDFDLNGSVDSSDVYWVVFALTTGHPAGDIDGDGDFDYDDWDLYVTYYFG